MSLGSDIAAALPELRAEGESRMTETIRVVTFVNSTDKETGDVIQVESDPVYEGRARYKSAATASGEELGAGQQYVTQRPELHLPTGSAILPVNWFAIIEASSADSALVGVNLRVADKPTRGQVTAMRYPVEEDSR